MRQLLKRLSRRGSMQNDERASRREPRALSTTTGGECASRLGRRRGALGKEDGIHRGTSSRIGVHVHARNRGRAGKSAGRAGKRQRAGTRKMHASALLKQTHAGRLRHRYKPPNTNPRRKT
mgnify:CR=1 FL=1